MKAKYNTDLACENLNYRENNHSYSEENLGYCSVIRQNVRQNAMKSNSEYITIFCDKLNLLDEYTLSLISLTLGEELVGVIKNIFCGRDINELSYLIVGLGNADFTADSIGPCTVSMLYATRHLNINNTNETRIPDVSIFAPGVLSKSGIETVNVVKSISKEILPDLIIAIDALSARSCERLGKTIQISSDGIAPGSGVRNAQTAINEKTVGIPVISVGVPTVVDSATLVLDTLEKAGFEDIDENLFSVLKEAKTFFVTPKESDEIIKLSAKLISKAINNALGIIS